MFIQRSSFSLAPPYNGRPQAGVAYNFLVRTEWRSPPTAKSAEKLYDEGCANCDSEIAVGRSGYRPADRLAMASR